MTKHKGLVVIKHEPYKMIEYFTKNYSNEIGAFGIGKINKDGSVLIEKLVFTKQTVNSCHVAIKPKDWGELVKELDIKDLQNIIFYWHKHPDGSCSSSQGDEDETYDLLMDTDTGNRELMVFLITSKIDNRMEYECRIEMRKPIKASIEADLIEEEELGYEEKCKKILEKNIIKPVVKKYKSQKVYGVDYDKSTFNNYIKTDFTTLEDDCNIEVFIDSGMIRIVIIPEFEEFIRLKLAEFKDLISSVYNSVIVDGKIKFFITPKKDRFNELKKEINFLYDMMINTEIYNKQKKKEKDKDILWNGYDNYY